MASARAARWRRSEGLVLWGQALLWCEWQRGWTCREVLHHCMVHPHVNVKEFLENDDEAYTTKEEFLQPLILIYKSLIDSGDQYIAKSRILDVIRQARLRRRRAPPPPPPPHPALMHAHMHLRMLAPSTAPKIWWAARTGRVGVALMRVLCREYLHIIFPKACTHEPINLHRATRDSVSAVLQVSTFGMGLVTLDVRQESSKHAQAMDAITTFLGLGSYMEWDEQKRREFLIAELNSKRPLMPAGAPPPRRTFLSIGDLAPEQLLLGRHAWSEGPASVLRRSAMLRLDTFVAAAVPSSDSLLRSCGNERCGGMHGNRSSAHRLLPECKGVPVTVRRPEDERRGGGRDQHIQGHRRAARGQHGRLRHQHGALRLGRAGGGAAAARDGRHGEDLLPEHHRDAPHTVGLPVSRCCRERLGRSVRRPNVSVVMLVDSLARLP